MGWLSSLSSSLWHAFSARSMENPRRPLDPWSNALGDSLDGSLSTSGVRVNRDKALTVPAFWRGVNLLTRTCAKLPLGVYRNVHPGREHDPDHAADWVVRKQPNEAMTPFTWKQLVVFQVIIEGNHYSYVVRDAGGRPVEVLPIAPDRTYPIRECDRSTGESALWYVHELPDGQARKLPACDVLHFKGLSEDGLEGIPLLRVGKNALGGALATAAYSEVFFRNSARPNVLLKHPGRLSPEARKNLRESWERMHQGLDNAHRTAILEEGLDAVPVQINARDAQLIEVKQYSLIEIANLLGLPPHKLGANISTSYGSLEQENRNYLDDAVGPWLIVIEEECERKLLSRHQRERDTHAIVFDRSTLLIADLNQRGSFYQQMISIGVMNPDEARAREGMNPQPGGIGKAYRRDGANYVGGDPDGPDGPAVAPGAELLDVPDVRQELPYACGAAAARTVCQHFGVGPKREAEYVELLGTSSAGGTTPASLLSFFSELGLATTSAHRMDVGDLSRAFVAGHPVLCPIQADAPSGVMGGHWVVVVGTGLGMVFVQDPVAGRRMFREEEWLARWHDRDAEGNRYERYGISVGTDLAAPVVVTGEDGQQVLALPAPAPVSTDDAPAAEVAPDGTVADVTDPTVVDAGPDLADTALNGAQVTALLEIVSQFGQGIFGADAAKAIIAAAFPTLDQNLIGKIINPADVKPVTPETAPAEAKSGVEPEPKPEPDVDAQRQVELAFRQSVEQALARLTTVQQTNVDVRQTRVVEAARACLLEAVGRSIKRLGHAARRAASDPAKFVTWLERLHGEHGETCRQIVTPPLDVLREAAGDGPAASSFAAEVVEEVRAGLLEAAGRATPVKLADEVSAYLTVIEGDPSGLKAWKQIEKRNGTDNQNREEG